MSIRCSTLFQALYFVCAPHSYSRRWHIFILTKLEMYIFVSKSSSITGFVLIYTSCRRSAAHCLLEMTAAPCSIRFSDCTVNTSRLLLRLIDQRRCPSLLSLPAIGWCRSENEVMSQQNKTRSERDVWKFWMFHFVLEKFPGCLA